MYGCGGWEITLSVGADGTVSGNGYAAQQSVECPFERYPSSPTAYFDLSGRLEKNQFTLTSTFTRYKPAAPSDYGGIGRAVNGGPFSIPITAPAIAAFTARVLVERESPGSVVEDVIEFRQPHQKMYYCSDNGLPPRT